MKESTFFLVVMSVAVAFALAVCLIDGEVVSDALWCVAGAAAVCLITFIGNRIKRS